MVLVQKIHEHVIWFSNLRVLISFKSDHILGSMRATDYSLMSDLVLTAHVNVPFRLCVFKNRHIHLTLHKHTLDQIWSEYGIVDDGWRGAVQLTESEWMRTHLTWL